MIKVQILWELQIRNKINLGIVKKDNLYKNKIKILLVKKKQNNSIIYLVKLKNFKIHKMHFIKFYLFKRIKKIKKKKK